MDLGPLSSILIADDDPVGRRVLQALLGPEGYQLSFAVDGAEALDLARAKLPDVILLDVMMPRMDGFEVCRRLRADPTLSDVPVLMLTALDQKEARLKGIEAGADDFITKPYDTVELRARIRTIARLNRFRRMMREKERYTQLVEMSPYGIVVTDAEGIVRMVNPAFVELVRSASADEVIGRAITDYVAPDEVERCRGLRRALSRDNGGSAGLETEFVRQDGTRVAVAMEAGRLGWDGIDMMQVIVRDISERKRYQQQLERQANYDELTGLANRNLLQDRLTRALAHAEEMDCPLAVAMFDIDRFRVVNDSLGHEAGDGLLREIARRLAGARAPEDTMARFGGDNFVIVLQHVASQDEAAFFAQSMLDRLRDPVVASGQELFISASMGISLYPRDAQDPSRLLKHAETAMFRAKENGGAQFRFYAPEMHTRAMSVLKTEAALRRAIERSELVLFYQPKVDLASGFIVGAECLIRWRSGERGLIGPSDFIPLAEETGLILPIGEWTLRTACRQFRQWRDAGLKLGSLAVNVSARQFESGDLPRLAEALLAESDIPPQALEIELTESVLMRDPDLAARRLQALKELGTAISLDDFGTGYSSLSYLSQFRIDGLKIDQSFVRNVASNGDDAAIARTIISMAKTLGCVVVGEGGETREQMTFLRDNGCDQMQGYYFSRPLPAAEFEALLRREPRLQVGQEP